jgi:hypothetical protein
MGVWCEWTHCKKARKVSVLKMKQCVNVEKWIDCAMRAQMKSRILDSEDTALLAIANSEKLLKNDARSRMWFKRQFLLL